MGRLAALGWVAGVAFTHTRGELSSIAWVAAAALALILAGIVLTVAKPFGIGSAARMLAVAGITGGVACAGTAYAAYCARERLAQQLDPALEDKVTRVAFRVIGLSQDRDGARRFEAEVIESPVSGVPRRILVNWVPAVPRDVPQPAASRGSAHVLPEVLPGQVWRAALVLRRAHGAINPSGFDYEGWMFARGVRAIGKVRGEPLLLQDRSMASFPAIVARARHVVRAGMRQALGESRYGAVMIALAIGDQDGVPASDWRVFGRTGITHLVSISGSHVTLLAALGAWLAMAVWKRLRVAGEPACERLPARLLGAIVAVVVAWGYCLLAGWGVPARRTFLMLAVAALGVGMRLPLSPTRILCAAAALVVLADPWAPMATGFWLSFGAVAVLFGAGAGAARTGSLATGFARMRDALRIAARLQWLITLAMLPVLAFLFQQASVSSPLANAIAIPVITFIVTPLALATGLLAVVPGFGSVAAAAGWAGHLALEWTLLPVTWLSHARWATLDLAQAPWPLLAAALGGVVWALQPPGVPARWAGWCLLAPALAWQPSRPAPGEWRLLALDVGQGSAVVVRTQQEDLLFDAGPAIGSADAGERVVAPALRALGIRKLSALVVSHADLDHAGGLPGLLSAVRVDKAYASFDLAAVLRRLARDRRGELLRSSPGQVDRCVRGARWRSGGVTFEFLHPPDTVEEHNVKAGMTNARSCVLRITGEHHRVLLTGDIGVREERMLVDAHDAGADVVVVAHHGSRTSSSAAFISATGASHALVQAGRHNRFGHPHPGVMQRWREAGTTLWRTDLHGAVVAQSIGGSLQVHALRQTHPRYWHGQ